MKEPGEPLIETIQESVMQAGILYYGQNTGQETREIYEIDGHRRDNNERNHDFR